MRLLVLAVLITALAASAGAGARHVSAKSFDRKQINHFIIIYQENWSFDGLYSRFPGADGFPAGRRVAQTDARGRRIRFMNWPTADRRAPVPTTRWPNPMPVAFYDLADFGEPGKPLFAIDTQTADVMHRFYHHRLQLHGGASDRFLQWSDLDPAKPPGPDNRNSLCMSAVDASDLPEGRLAKAYVLADHCFQSAYGGSFLSHQFLIAARAPIYVDAKTLAPGVISKPSPENGGDPRVPSAEWDKPLSAEPVARGSNDYFVVNTLFPPYAPTAFEPSNRQKVLPPQTHRTIGDALDEGGKTWAWFAEHWNENKDAALGKVELLFQMHHQPFNYFEKLDPATHAAYRAEHLKDLKDFESGLAAGVVPNVSFVKFYGERNEHPNYAVLKDGQEQVERLVRAIQASPIWSDCAIIITYDEFGGRWDHVKPPAGDEWGPATRVPMIIISPFAKRGHVDHTTYETVSILSTIESRWGLPPLTKRDARARPIWNAFE